MFTDLQLAQVFEGYATSALWTSIDDDGRALDDRFDVGDIARASREEMRADIADFVSANAEDLGGMSPEQIGHDFWLTRNRHGAGFWDRGLGARGDRLTANAHPYGESDLYVGDDGLVYVS